jgi:hypothetical protein
VNFKFGDVVVNGYASLDNPIRKGIFVKETSKGYEMTDGKGRFWISGKHDKLIKIENVVRDGWQVT